MLDFDFNKMIFAIPSEKHSEDDLRKVLLDHPEIRFVSFVGLDIAGNDTDERIPVERFLCDIKGMLEDGVSTDGSSVNLPKIAELNNGRVSMIPDTSVKWYLDYNYENIDLKTGLPIGTLRIPAFLVHNDKHEVGSRVILRDATEKLKSELISLIKRYPYCLKESDGKLTAGDIDEILIDGTSSDDIGELVLKDRELLSSNGLVIISATLNKKEKTLLVGPEVMTRGFIYDKESADILDEVKKITANVIENNIHNKYADYTKIRNDIRLDVGAYLNKETQCKPVILTVIQEI